MSSLREGDLPTSEVPDAESKGAQWVTREDVERLAARSSPLPDGWLRGNEPLWSPQGVHS